MNAELAGLIKDYVDKVLRGILIGCVASIERHDLATMRADVKPLIMFTPAGQTAQSNYAIIPDIPVLFIFAGGYYIRPEYKRGDLVWVTFATYDISPSLSGRNTDGDGDVFPRESAAVVQGIAKKGWSPPSDFSASGLAIGSLDGKASFLISSGVITAKIDSFEIEGDVSIKGNIETEGDLTVTGNVTSTGKISADLEVEAHAAVPATSVKLGTHTHTSTAPGNPTSPPTPGT